jgi:hypothetical protein
MWDYEKVGNEVAVKMLIVDGVEEPTLAQIQKNAENSVHSSKKKKSIPAWRSLSNPHPGLPQHFLATNSINDLRFPSPPFSMVNREIEYKMLIKLDNSKQKRRLPSFPRLTNGTIIVTGHRLPVELSPNIEIFLHMFDKLLPCCHTLPLHEIIIESPESAVDGHIRVYYVHVEHAVTEATFLSSKGDVIHRCDYKEILLHGSTPFQELFTAIQHN